MMMKRLFALVVAWLLLASPALAQQVRNGGTPATASATGGLTATGGAFSLGGDTGSVTYTSPGGLGLGKATAPGSLTLFGTTSGSIKFAPNTGALGSTVVTWPATTGTIGADAFLGAGAGLTSSGGNLILGDAQLTYQTGSAKWVASDNTIGSSNIRTAWQFGYTSNLTTTSTNNFSDNVGMYIPVTNNVGQNVYDTHDRAKTTFISLFLDTTDIAAGQRTAFQDTVKCYGMGDCSASNWRVQYGGGPIAGDEGQNFTASQFLEQQPFITNATITAAPAPTACNTTTVSSVNGSSTVQTVTVASAANCNVNDWIVINAGIPSNTAYVEAVKITAVNLGANTITGKFQNDWTIGAIVNPFTSIVQGTCPGGGSTCDGTYAAKPLTGGSGTGGTATVTVSAGVASISIVGQGDNYVVGDVVSVAPANMGGITGFSATVGTTCCGPRTVTPATVLTVSSTNQWGEQRVLVNHNPALAYTTGQAAGAAWGVSGAFTGIGTTWNSPTGPIGGTSLNPGCIALAADRYSGPAGATGAIGFVSTPLDAWYEIASVGSATSMAIYKTSVANDSSYQGNGQYASFTGSISGTTLTSSAEAGIIAPGTVLQGAGITAGTTIVSGSSHTWVVSISQTVGSEAMVASNSTDVGLGTGAYTISPCARILKVVSNQVVLETNSFTWTVADSVEQIISPYADVHGVDYIAANYIWGPGIAYRSMLELDNRGARTMGVGLYITSSMQVGGGADTAGWQIGANIDHANIGLQIGFNTPFAIDILNSTAPICWGNTGGTCFGPNAILGTGNTLLINFVGGGTAGLTLAGASGSLWAYNAQASNANNPIANPLPTLEWGGNFLVSAIGHANNETTVALANVIGFDSRTAATFQSFLFGNTDGITESTVAQKMLIYASKGIHLYGNTNGTDPTGSNSSLGTVTVFQGNLSEAELALENNALTQNVTFSVIAAGDVSLGGNGNGAGLALTASTIANLPTCNGTLSGDMRVISNGIASPTLNGLVGSTTGPNVDRVLCNGTAWVY